MTIELKIKSKSLDAEAQIIRSEERKLKKQAKYYRNAQLREEENIYARKFLSIQSHRKWDVRNEARATFLARAYIDGRSYASVEHKVHSPYILKQYIAPRVHAMVVKYHNNRITREMIDNWLEGKKETLTT